MTLALRCAMSALVLTSIAACSSTPGSDGSSVVRDTPPDAPTGSHIMRRSSPAPEAKAPKRETAEAVVPGTTAAPAR